jgi:hypothetical protein
MIVRRRCELTPADINQVRSAGRRQPYGTGKILLRANEPRTRLIWPIDGDYYSTAAWRDSRDGAAGLPKNNACDLCTVILPDVGAFRTRIDVRKDFEACPIETRMRQIDRAIKDGDADPEVTQCFIVEFGKTRYARGNGDR